MQLSLFSTNRIPVRTLMGSFVLLAVSTLLGAAPAAASVKVAFVGDQGVGDAAKAVLSLIANEGTDLLLIQGDLGYDDNTAEKWDSNLDNALGVNFPVLTVVGNHEKYEWELYQKLIQRRIDRVGGLSCAGEAGVKAVCRYDNIDIVQVAPGIREIAGVKPDDDYAGFIRSAFSGSPGNRWRICSWHKNQKNLQTGAKNNSTGWDVYDACLDAGAMVALAHEHAYSRTYLLSNFENQSVVHRNSSMTLESGRSFAFVSGLGGFSIRPQERDGDWWASVYTASQGATHGALFCDFQQQTADCYFKAIDGSVPDQFSLKLGGSGSSQSVAPPAPQPETLSESSQPASQSASQFSGKGYVFARTDKSEYRWIDKDSNGGAGNVWIDESCVDSMGGVSVWGDWGELVSRAPNMDSIAYPCNGSSGSTAASSASNDPSSQGANQESTPAPSGAGYVFSRTDKQEFRWIDVDGSGGVGNIWIDKSCSDNLGGPSASGDWNDLQSRAPNMDSVSSPCDGNQGSSSASSSSAGGSSDTIPGFVFARTDRDEYRWIDQDNSSGGLGSIWIDKACADSFGGPKVSGDWDALTSLAPAFDAIENPCK